MRRKDDILWKGILEDVFEDFLRFLSPDSAAVLDLNRKFEFLDKELEQVFPPENDEYAPKVVDKLARVTAGRKSGYWCMLKYRDNSVRISPGACLLIFTGFWINIKSQLLPMPFLQKPTQ